MHIAAASPKYVRREEVPAAELEREKDIYRDQARQTGKPEAVIDKIIEGKIEKFYSDVCLLDQVFVKDPEGKMKISLNREDRQDRREHLERTTAFAKFVLGEGLAKKESDFAAEVAAAVGT